jgi:hypothetical protein
MFDLPTEVKHLKPTNMTTANAISSTGHDQVPIKKPLPYDQQKLHELSDYAWLVAYTALWNGHHFTGEETEYVKACINGYLQQGTSYTRQYRQLAERVLLARFYLNSHPGKKIPLPAEWFCTQNSEGFAATAKWYKTVQHTRETRPLYKHSLSVFPDDIRDTIRSGDATSFHYWRSCFIQQKANGLLNLYLATIANYHRCNQ